ncbi:MAG: TetR/AcrR family transcriptional regulator [Rubrivivax sp.]|nr:MAG: TetR/AcrR family transcriptional regulator [Rubrivivax sp.]
MDKSGMDAECTDRPYMGLSEEKRIAERRHRLVDAGIRIAGARGCAEIGVRSVCAEADLSHRYFYESFKCKHELLFTAYEQLQEDLIATVIPAMGHQSEDCVTRLNRSIEAFLQFFEHNTHARWILLFDRAIPSALSKSPHWRLLSEYEALLTDELSRGAVGSESSNREARAVACGLLGATVQLTVRWLARRPDEPIDKTLAALRFIYGAAIQSCR